MQADLSRTVDPAPKVSVLWQELPDSGERCAYVGTSTTSYFTADGEVQLSRDYAAVILSIAAAVQDATNDGLLGGDHRSYWPRCAEYAFGLDAWVDQNGRCVWRCRHDGKVIAESVTSGRRPNTPRWR